MKDSILLVDKPAGISSFDVIRKLKKSFYSAGLTRKDIPKMGHGGTLDPFATGLLIVLLGEAAKLSGMFLGSVKGYEGEIVFGASTPSGDIDTEVDAQVDVPLSIEGLEQCASTFVQEVYLQKPPMYSAKKINGQKLYELARKNKVVEREAVLRKIDAFEIFDFDGREARFKVSCSAGTYVRVLAEDLAKKLGSLAHLKSLRRVSSGALNVSEAMSLQTLEEEMKSDVSLQSCSACLPLLKVISDDLKLELPKALKLEVLQGKVGPLDWVKSLNLKSSGSFFLTHENELLAWLELSDDDCRYRRVFIKQPQKN